MHARARTPARPSRLRSFARSLARSFARAARSSILSVLEAAIQVGYLEIEDEDETFHFGTPKAGGVAAHLKVLSGKFWTRVFG